MTLDERGEWLVWRKSGIGASDVAALCGMSKWASPMSVWTDKMGLSHDEDNDLLEYGRRAEPMLTGYFEDRTGLLVVQQQRRAEHPDNAVHRATLDGIAVEHPEGDWLGVVEYKTAERGTEKDWAVSIPDAYQIQVQWQMHVAGLHHAWFGVLHGRKFVPYEVERDQPAIDVLVQMVDAFWSDHVLAEKPPPADAHRATSAALALAYPDPVEGEAVPLDEVAWALDLKRSAAHVIHDAKADIARADNAIKAAIGDAEIGTIQGEPVMAWKQQTREAHEVKASTFRVLRPIKGKKS